MAKNETPRQSSTIGGAMKRSDAVRVRAIGIDGSMAFDVFHQLMRMTWVRFAALFALAFIAFNLIFATVYYTDPTGLSVPGQPGEIPLFWRDFFFSVHTVATIGYGNVYPISLFANTVVVVEITSGILFFALTTGIVFARFSRPTARILFSNVAVIRTVDGVARLMLRAANQRHNLVYSASVEVAVLADEEVAGTTLRRFHDLKLVREHNPVFALTWTVMHVIDDDSPLRDWLTQTPAADAEIIVLLSGYDENSGQTIYGRWAYGVDDLRWNARFADIIGLDDNGTRTIDYARFHTTEDAPPVSLPEAAEAPH